MSSHLPSPASLKSRRYQLKQEIAIEMEAEHLAFASNRQKQMILARAQSLNYLAHESQDIDDQLEKARELCDEWLHDVHAIKRAFERQSDLSNRLHLQLSEIYNRLQRAQNEHAKLLKNLLDHDDISKNIIQVESLFNSLVNDQQSLVASPLAQAAEAHDTSKCSNLSKTPSFVTGKTSLSTTYSKGYNRYVAKSNTHQPSSLRHLTMLDTKQASSTNIAAQINQYMSSTYTENRSQSCLGNSPVLNLAFVRPRASLGDSTRESWRACQDISQAERTMSYRTCSVKKRTTIERFIHRISSLRKSDSPKSPGFAYASPNLACTDTLLDDENRSKKKHDYGIFHCVPCMARKSEMNLDMRISLQPSHPSSASLKSSNSVPPHVAQNENDQQSPCMSNLSIKPPSHVFAEKQRSKLLETLRNHYEPVNAPIPSQPVTQSNKPTLQAPIPKRAQDIALIL